MARGDILQDERLREGGRVVKTVVQAARQLADPAVPDQSREPPKGPGEQDTGSWAGSSSWVGRALGGLQLLVGTVP